MLKAHHTLLTNSVALGANGLALALILVVIRVIPA